MLALVLGWTQCLPQGVGAPPAMLRERTAGFPKKLVGRRGGVGGYNLHSVPPNSPPDCGTVAHQPRAGCIRLVLYFLFITFILHFFLSWIYSFCQSWSSNWSFALDYTFLRPVLITCPYHLSPPPPKTVVICQPSQSFTCPVFHGDATYPSDTEIISLVKFQSEFKF